MQVNRRARLPEGLRPDQATSANARFHLMPVDKAISTVVVGKKRYAFSWPEKSLDQFSVSNGVQGNDAASIVITDGALLGLAANHRVTANNFPHSPADPPSNQWHQSYYDQQSSVPQSRPPAPFTSSAADSTQWDSRGGARPKNKCSAIHNNNGTPTHLTCNVNKGLSFTGIDPWFIARHSQDDYFKNPEKVAADLNNRIVDMKSCMTGPFSGYDASPWSRNRSVGNGELPAYNRVDPLPHHVTAGSDYCELPPAPASSRTQQSGNLEYSASDHQQCAGAISNGSTGVAGGFLAAHSGSGYSSYSRSKKSEEVEKTIDVSTTVHILPGQRVDEPASGQSQKKPDVPLSSTAPCETDTDESDHDDCLTELKQRIDEACTMVEGILEHREEKEKFAARIKRLEDKKRADRAIKKREMDETLLEYAKSWPASQNAVNLEITPCCEHYRRRCRVKFECCNVFYSCHRCHNNSKECSNVEAKALEATHYKCSNCGHEEKIDENSHHCSRCEARMSAYFCPLCKHFTSNDKIPYHCEKCGICRINKGESFHCDACDVCLNKKLEGKHKCRPGSRHDQCCICLEDAFSGCQILPCSHRIHRECAVAMINNGIRTCPICRYPLYSSAAG